VGVFPNVGGLITPSFARGKKDVSAGTVAVDAGFAPNIFVDVEPTCCEEKMLSAAAPVLSAKGLDEESLRVGLVEKILAVEVEGASDPDGAWVGVGLLAKRLVLNMPGLLVPNFETKGFTGVSAKTGFVVRILLVEAAGGT
jgi:hypothetical protein